jgi:hypothetical protein
MRQDTSGPAFQAWLLAAIEDRLHAEDMGFRFPKLTPKPPRFVPLVTEIALEPVMSEEKPR